MSIEGIGSLVTECGWVAADSEAATYIEPKGAFPSTRFEAWATEDYLLGAAELRSAANGSVPGERWVLLELATIDGDETRWVALLDKIARSPSKDTVEGDFVTTIWARDAVPETLLGWRFARNRGEASYRLSYFIVRQR